VLPLAQPGLIDGSFLIVDGLVNGIGKVVSPAIAPNQFHRIQLRIVRRQAEK